MQHPEPGTIGSKTYAQLDTCQSQLWKLPQQMPGGGRMCKQVMLMSHFAPEKGDGSTRFSGF